MHEATLAKNIIDLINEQYKIEDGKKIISVKLRIGELSGVYPESLEYYFQEFSKNTILENSSLIFEKAPIKVKCILCSNEFEIKGFEYNCNKCGSDKYNIISGDELEIINLEVDDGNNNC